jgi:hypothetical protein
MVVVVSAGIVSVVDFTSFPFEAHPTIAKTISKALPDFIHFCISISNSFLVTETANAAEIETNCLQRESPHTLSTASRKFVTTPVILSEVEGRV